MWLMKRTKKSSNRFVVVAVVATMLLLTLSLRLSAQPIVSFSHDGGCYPSPIRLALELDLSVDLAADNQDYVIRYTLNGSAPDANSPCYRKPFLLDEKCYSRSNIYKIQNAPDEHWYCPEEVERIIVVRAAAFDQNGKRCSEVFTESYVIESLLGRKIHVAIVSLCVDSVDLFDYQNGIFVPGATFDPKEITTTGNYYRRGRAHEKAAHFEFFEDGGEDRVAQDCGFRTHGNISRRYAQKGISLYARAEYGEKNFKGIWNDVKDKRLVLRPFCSAWTQAGVQNYFCQMLVPYAGLKFDALNCKPVVLFLNGEYWGLYYLEEKPDEKLISKRYRLDPQSVRMVQDWAGHSDGGFDSSFVAMMQWVAKTDFSDDAQYTKIQQQVDIESFIDYILFETYIGNRDWPANNMRCWSADGSPWRFIFFDGDAVRTTQFKAVANAVSADTTVVYPTSAESTLLLRKLMENKQFRKRFHDRMVDLYTQKLRWKSGGVFGIGDGVAPLFGVVRDDICREIAAQSARFGYPTSEKEWNKAMKKQKRYFKRRARVVRREWEQYLATMEGRPSSRGSLLLILSAVLAVIIASAAVAYRCLRRSSRGR